MSAITYNNARPYTVALWRLIQAMVGTTPDGIEQGPCGQRLVIEP